MNGDVEGVASRPRPLSGGLWTLFSWLRRDDHASSNESLSSVGSDRTAASFAFLAPAHYSVKDTPVFLPPPSPPTDSYRKRVQERNVRRQHERDLTLHRKYGLYGGEISNGYDAFSLPPARRAEGDISSKWERERRATSECFQRRALHVPGKRRAPLPPGRAPVGAHVKHYRGPRKRPAPQPPNKLIGDNKERQLESNNICIPMNPHTARNDQSLQSNSTMATNTNEKFTKKGSHSKDAKIRLEKGFLKNIFENKKRNSVIDTSAVKILPSISELDKQAATIIENVKLEALKQNSKLDKQNQQNILENSNKKSKADNWFCIKCLRKYDSSVTDCPNCIFERKQPHAGELLKANDATNASSIYTQTHSGFMSKETKNNKSEDKQKLKDMLKEMKDSLPKRAKHGNKEHILSGNSIVSNVSEIVEKDSVSETPTLRIGTSAVYDGKTSLFTKASTSGPGSNLVLSKNTAPLESFNSVITSIPVVIHHDAKQNNPMNDTEILKIQKEPQIDQPKESIRLKSSPCLENVQKTENRLLGASCTNKNLQTPLRISSLLNPVYIPKSVESNKTGEKKIHAELKSHTNAVKIDKTVTQITAKPHVVYKNANINAVKDNKGNFNLGHAIPVTSNETITNEKNTKNNTTILNHVNNTNDARPSTSTDMAVNDSKIKKVDMDGLNQHIKRRELINQLEKSIASGDEHAAAEAAIKLAQLRLSCSVLSFSSQIISEPSSATTTIIVPEKNKSSGLLTIETTKNTPQKSASENVNATVGLDMASKSNTVIASMAANEQSPQHNEIKLNHPSENDKPVSSSVTNISETIDPHINNKRNVSQSTGASNVTTTKEKGNTDVSITVWVEDKEATRGPIKLNTHRQAIVGDLRKQAEAALGLPSHLQRWIVGRTLCTDDNTTLVTLAGSELNAPFYLCLVETDPHAAGTSLPIEKKTADVADTDNKTGTNVYKELVQLEQQALVPNAEVFECGVCIEECKPGDGVILRECVHMFCKDCLADVVRHSEEPDISCPAMACKGLLQEREIRGLVSPEDYERWLARGLAAAESGTRNAFHCRTRDCTGWALCDPGVRRFLCPVCKHSNCVPCQAIHEGETCEKHQAKLQAVSTLKSSGSDDSTRALLHNLINKGEALECPECKAIITKMWGCDWVKCSACKTEICWVTRGRRWGPAGRGDTSAGCRCGLDGKRCHPSCGYCH